MVTPRASSFAKISVSVALARSKSSNSLLTAFCSVSVGAACQYPILIGSAATVSAMRTGIISDVNSFFINYASPSSIFSIKIMIVRFILRTRRNTRFTKRLSPSILTLILLEVLVEGIKRDLRSPFESVKYSSNYDYHYNCCYSPI